MAFIILKDKPYRYGKSRTEQDDNLIKDGWGTGFASEEDKDKCKYLEKKISNHYTIDGKCFLRAGILERIK